MTITVMGPHALAAEMGRRFTGQVAVVTGATGGIGAAIALALADEGAAVCLVGRHAQRLEAIGGQARRNGRRAVELAVDLLQDAEITALRARVERDCGQVDILVHAAGICLPGSVADAGVEDFDAQYRLNLRAPYVLTRALLPMLRARRGQIVFINSSVGLATRGGISQYAATKHGLHALADCLRDEVNPDGVRVLSVFPGRTATPGQAALHALEGKAYQPDRLLQPEDVASAVIGALALERTAEVTNVMIRPMQKS